jgi:hypothetical protein
MGVFALAGNGKIRMEECARLIFGGESRRRRRRRERFGFITLVVNMYFIVENMFCKTFFHIV